MHVKTLISSFIFYYNKRGNTVLRAVWLLDPARGSSGKGHLQTGWIREDEGE